MEISKEAPVLPDFIIIGAMRAGTTTLYNLLKTHPDISMSREKETDFFIDSKNWKRGLSWYSKQFDSTKQIRGEVSPNYSKRTVFTGVPERMYKVCPRVKIIYIVREPVARATSHFFHMQVHSPEKISKVGQVDEHHYRILRDTSSYSLQVKPYLSQFPNENILIIDFDQMPSNMQVVMNKICDFIGASRKDFSKDVVSNSSSTLNKIPRIAINASKIPAVKILSPEIRNFMKSLLLKMNVSKDVTDINPDLLSRLQAELRPDIDEFRVITGQKFMNW